MELNYGISLIVTADKCQSVCTNTHIRITLAGHLNVVKTDQAIKGRRLKHNARMVTKSVSVSLQTFVGYVAPRGPTTSPSTIRVSALAASSSSTRNGM